MAQTDHRRYQHGRDQRFQGAPDAARDVDRHLERATIILYIIDLGDKLPDRPVNRCSLTGGQPQHRADHQPAQ